MQTMVHKTIRGDYDPRNPDLYLLIQKNFLPQLATFMEPIKTYSDKFDGIIFCLKTRDTTTTTAKKSLHGGSSIPKNGFSRSEGI